jgi:glycine/D-amino acid oxidase-like deaminating enzyme
MMRFINPGKDNRIGASLCGGLSLVHYDSFKAASSLAALKERYRQELPEYIDNGIHVMVSQNGNGELTVGDSHHYGITFSPFDEAKINQLIMDYLKTFAKTGHWQPVQSWHGIYPKMKDGSTEVFLQADEGVFILNGVGGAGMTLSFGLAEEIIGRL